MPRRTGELVGAGITTACDSFGQGCAGWRWRSCYAKAIDKSRSHMS